MEYIGKLAGEEVDLKNGEIRLGTYRRNDSDYDSYLVIGEVLNYWSVINLKDNRQGTVLKNRAKPLNRKVDLIL